MVIVALVGELLLRQRPSAHRRANGDLDWLLSQDLRFSRHVFNGIADSARFCPLGINGNVARNLSCKIEALFISVVVPIPAIENVAVSLWSLGNLLGNSAVFRHVDNRSIVIVLRIERHRVIDNLGLGVKNEALRHGVVTVVRCGVLGIKVPAVERATHCLAECVSVITEIIKIGDPVGLVVATTNQLKRISMASVVERPSARIIPRTGRLPVFLAVVPFANGAGMAIVSINLHELFVIRRTTSVINVQGNRGQFAEFLIGSL